MENTEQNDNNKVQIGTKVAPDIFSIVKEIAVLEDRSISNTVERLLKTHPRIQPLLEAETAGAGA